MPDHALQLDARSPRRPIIGLAAAVMALVAVIATPAQAAPLAATATPAPQARGEAGHADSIHEVDGDLVGSDPNFYGVIPGSGHCSWRFNVAEEPGIVYSALDCSRPRGRTHALVGTNPATGCNDARVCEFLDKSSIDWD